MNFGNPPAASNNSKKVLLMGRHGAGKTSMRSIIFANYLAQDTRRLTATNHVEHSHLRFLGNMVLSLWDCGGQDVFMENYFDSQRDHIFRNCKVLIYVIEARGSTVKSISEDQKRHLDVTKDIQYFSRTLESVKQFSPDSLLFCLIHKMDIVEEKENMMCFYTEKLQAASAEHELEVSILATSIWDETLFKAWSQIVCALVPNISQLETMLQKFLDNSEADEVILFEKSTFLVICHATRIPASSDEHRFEKVSNICKQFKLTCAKTRSNFWSLCMTNSHFTLSIERFTQNTYIMVVVSDPDLEPSVPLCHVEAARKDFEQITEQMRLGTQ